MIYNNNTMKLIDGMMPPTTTDKVSYSTKKTASSQIGKTAEQIDAEERDFYERIKNLPANIQALAKADIDRVNNNLAYQKAKRDNATTQSSGSGSTSAIVAAAAIGAAAGVAALSGSNNAKANKGSSEDDIRDYMENVNIPDDMKDNVVADMLDSDWKVPASSSGGGSTYTPTTDPATSSYTASTDSQVYTGPSEYEQFITAKSNKGITNEDMIWLTAHYGSEKAARKAVISGSASDLKYLAAKLKSSSPYSPVGSSGGDYRNQGYGYGYYLNDKQNEGTYSNPIESEEYKNGLFNSPEEVAYAFGMKYNEQSINEDVEYGANIFAVDVDGEIKYSYDKAYKGSYNSVVKMAAADWINRSLLALSPIKSEEIPVGSVHTHSAWKSDTNLFFSKEDVVWLNGDTYMVAPDGTLHYLSGNTTSYNYSWPTQKYIDESGIEYGEIVRHGLPHDTNSNMTPYTPQER